MDVEDLSVRSQNGNKEHVIGNHKKGEPCHKMAETWLNECSSILSTFVLGNNKIGYLSEQIAQESFKGACLFLTAYTKMQEERNDLKKV